MPPSHVNVPGAHHFRARAPAADAPVAFPAVVSGSNPDGDLISRALAIGLPGHGEMSEHTTPYVVRIARNAVEDARSATGQPGEADVPQAREG